jgi:hypothetical protein
VADWHFRPNACGRIIVRIGRRAEKVKKWLGQPLERRPRHTVSM